MGASSGLTKVCLDSARQVESALGLSVDAQKIPAPLTYEKVPGLLNHKRAGVGSACSGLHSADTNELNTCTKANCREK